ncbi:MAG: phosphate transport system substrate-binding protein [Actinomycetota bacterium]|nr:phosphate transport system substrate-binding protein [Actinomycetota bacterium]
MKRIRAGAALLTAGALLLAGPAALAATHPDTTVTGAGATFPLNIIEQWKADFKKSDNVTIAYTGVGSGAGRTQLIAGTVDFAGSDVLASADETNQLKSKYGDFVYIPETSGGIAVLYKVSGLSNLKLSGPTLAKIFAGTITNWNDNAIQVDNGAPGPNLAIQVYVRQDKSGTSGVFTEYLSKTGGTAWTAGATQTFPTDHGQIGKSGSDGVANAVAAAEGGIGYAEHSFAVERSLAEVSVKNGSGVFKTPGAANVTAAIDDATTQADGSLLLNFTTSAAEAYPISTVSYFLVPTKMDANKGDNLKAFLAYALGSTGQGKATPLGYAPLPAKIQALAVGQAAKVNPAAATTTTQTTAAPTTTTTAVKVSPAVVPTAAPDPALASSGRSFALPVTVGALLLLVGMTLLLRGRARRTG